MINHAKKARPAPELVLRKALFRAAEQLELGQKDLAAILGVSESTVSRIAAGTSTIAPKSNEGERALCFLRVYRSLDTLVGGERDKVCLWFRARNKHLNGVPAELVTTMRGLVVVADYLDAMRGTY